MRRTRRMSPWAALWLGLAGLALAQELRKPATARTWHGQVLGIIPYDFRLPTLERIRARVWNPHEPRLLTEQIFGVGWSINVYRLAAAVGATRQRSD